MCYTTSKTKLSIGKLYHHLSSVSSYKIYFIRLPTFSKLSSQKDLENGDKLYIDCSNRFELVLTNCILAF
jgi:hypothetical protein